MENNNTIAVDTRCAICGWQLADDLSKGCVRGNCSQRPFPPIFYDFERAVREYGKSFDAKHRPSSIPQDEAQELKRLFDLQHTRMVAADKAWQQAHNSPNTLPDLGTLIDWLMVKANEGTRLNALLNKHADELNPHFDDGIVSAEQFLAREGFADSVAHSSVAIAALMDRFTMFSTMRYWANSGCYPLTADSRDSGANQPVFISSRRNQLQATCPMSSRMDATVMAGPPDFSLTTSPTFH